MTTEATNLLTHYLFQKFKLLERAGKREPQTQCWDRAVIAYGPHMEKVAELIRNWDIEAGLLMEACFAWAKKNRHPNGPLPNMLTSQKYLTNALMHHLELPYEVLQDRKALDYLMGDLDKLFEETQAALSACDDYALMTLTSYPLEHRLLIAWGRVPKASDVVRHLAPDLLERAANDRKLDLWLRRRNMAYEDLASFYNQI